MKIFSVKKLIIFYCFIVFGRLTCERPPIPDPGISIIQPSFYTTFDTSSVTFIWEANEDANEFSYSLDNIVWSDWFEATTLTLHYLDEGEHIIWINARFSDLYESDNSLEVTFEVDAIQGPSLRLFPLLRKANIGVMDTVYVFVEEVENVMATELEIAYDPGSLDPDSIRVTGDSLFTGFGSKAIMIQEHDRAQGIIHLNLGVADEEGISGSGAVILIEFLPVIPDTFSFDISGEATFRDSNNVNINILKQVSGRVEVTE